MLKIDKNNKSARKILYLWNPHIHDNILNYALDNNWEIWTFDTILSKKYGFEFNHQFYPMNYRDKKKSGSDCKIDFLFIGYNKGRFPILMDLKRKFDSQGLSSVINIREWSRCSFLKFKDTYEDGIKITYKEVPYSKVLEYIKNSKCLIDIVQNGQEGLTMRAMEAVCFKRKLLTNNRSIKYEKIYNKNNIFILGVSAPRNTV